MSLSGGHQARRVRPDPPITVRGPAQRLLNRRLSSEERLDRVVELADNPWEGLTGFLDQLPSCRIQKRGLKEIIIGSDHGTALAAHARARLGPLSEQLVRRAQTSGTLRDDVVATDLPLLQFMVSSAAELTPPHAPQLWRRYLALAIDGLRTPRPAPAPAAGPKPRRTRRCRAYGARTGHRAADKPAATLTGRMMRRRQLARRCHSSSCRSCTTSRSSSAAGLVACSRVHTGVHYPVDVIAGSLTGGALAPLAVAALERRRRRSRGESSKTDDDQSPC